MTQSTDNETKKETGPEVPPPGEASASRQDELEQARKSAAESQERYLRVAADLENFRKRMVREKDELRQFGTSAVMQDLLPILDNLALGLAAAQQQSDVKVITEGVALVLDQFKSTLARHGLKEINPDGEVFDPNHHECIAHQPHESVAEEKVIQVVRPGYSLNGRLLRPASVIVSSGPAKSSGKTA
jgi:molecular chaperone GrpE